MQFRRNGLRDERRRRTLMEDRAGDDARQLCADSNGVGPKAPPRTYSKSANDERRLRIVDIVPLYPFQVTVLYTGFALLAAALLALHHYVGGLIRWADLTRVDSLGTWIASGALLLGALTALLIFRIRRHRLDDYRGRYRCWLWFASLLLLASLDMVLNFRSDVAIGLESLTQLRLLGRTDAWWAAVWTLAFGAMALRAALEVRESAGTLVLGALSATLLATGMGLQLDLLLLPANLSADMVLHAARLGGLGLLMAALVQYARYVWLDAQGLIAHETCSGAVLETDVEQATLPKPRAKSRAVKKPVEKKVAEKKPAAEVEDDAANEAEPARSRGWFSFGRKKSADAPLADDEQESSPTKQAKQYRAERPAARKVAHPSSSTEPESEESQEAAKPKRGWFSFGQGNQAAEGKTQENGGVKPVPTKRTKASRPLASKAAVKSSNESESEADEGAAAKRPWFAFGRKQSAERDIAAEDVPSVKSKKDVAKPVESAEKPQRKSWFGWARQTAAENDTTDDTEAAPKTMTPRITTRPKGAAPQPERSATSPPTITGKYSQVDDDADYGNDFDDGGADSGDEEILRLESKPDHLLSKAERRRLKKLKRRAA